MMIRLREYAARHSRLETQNNAQITTRYMSKYFLYVHEYKGATFSTNPVKTDTIVGEESISETHLEIALHF